MGDSDCPFPHREYEGLSFSSDNSERSSVFDCPFWEFGILMNLECAVFLLKIKINLVGAFISSLEGV